MIAAEKRLEQIDRGHAEQRMKVLKTFEQAREQQRPVPDKQLSDSWKQALLKTAATERDRSKEKMRGMSDDLDKLVKTSGPRIP